MTDTRIDLDYSNKMSKVLFAIIAFETANGFQPSIRDLVDMTGMKSTSLVASYLDKLEDAGYIEREKGVARGIRLLVDPLVALETEGIT